MHRFAGDYPNTTAPPHRVPDLDGFFICVSGHRGDNLSCILDIPLTFSNMHRSEGSAADSYAHADSHWHRKRHWFTPRPHRLLHRVEPVLARQRGDLARFECAPDQAAAAFLRQHRVSGRSLLPGAAMLECCFAAACMLAGEPLDV